ncbi:hypothetical protein CAEBREN_08492 [Caenorhabditis brenneri]|uniref:Lin-15A/B-like domain-containing protein n=1 Tax=Caenorhabditis brenneri TaxID=135651 RepID=G0N191_CAEBE|nr:hypothetical protein CAEBREN_08492 [Caenorhabditis brenneri]
MDFNQISAGLSAAKNREFSFQKAVEFMKILSEQSGMPGLDINEQDTKGEEAGPSEARELLTPPPSPPPSKTFKCSICSEIQPEDRIKKVSMLEEKLIFMTAKVLEKEFTIQQAQQFLNAPAARKPICRAHFAECQQTLFGALNIQTAKEIITCSFDFAREVMKTVNKIKEDVKIWQFCNFLNNFVVRNIDRVRSQEMAKERKTPTRRPHTCSLCQQKMERHLLKNVTIKNEYLILLIGRILRRECSLENAKKEFSNTNYVFVCHAHFNETINEILKIFDLGNPVRRGAEEMFKTIMDSVKAINPQITDEQFVEEFLQFSKRAKKYLGIVSAL